MYQLSERPQALRCIRFEAVGAAGADNHALVIEEPPGLQLRLRTLIHSADVCASAYNPSFKMVASSDAAGTVSLVDLSKPAVLWLQVGQGAVVAGGCRWIRVLCQMRLVGRIGAGALWAAEHRVGCCTVNLHSFTHSHAHE